MRRDPRNLVKRIMLCMAILVTSAVFAVKLAAPASGILQPQRTNLSNRIHRAGDQHKILAVLEKKMGGERISEKLRDKLFALNEVQTRLVLSLCDRIADDARTTGGDIAYFLITAMIVLS